MPSSSRYSTCTVLDDGRIVPWLAASGPLSYTPEFPPPSDYYFQYSWILPGALVYGGDRALSLHGYTVLPWYFR